MRNITLAKSRPRDCSSWTHLHFFYADMGGPGLQIEGCEAESGHLCEPVISLLIDGEVLAIAASRIL